MGTLTRTTAPAPTLGGGGRSVAPPADGLDVNVNVGGGSWRPLSPERTKAHELLIQLEKDSGGDSTSIAGQRLDNLRKTMNVSAGTAPDGSPTERALPQHALEQQQAGNTLAIALAGLGVVGVGVALFRGGAWWASLLLFPAAGAAYYVSRFKPPAPVKE